MQRYLLPFICVFTLLLSSCTRQTASTADVPRLIPQSMRVAVAPFTQPLNPGQLITGQIPENQGLIPQDQLLALDLDLRQALSANTRRQYDFIAQRAALPNPAHSTGQAGALPGWLAFGKQHDAQLLLVPMVLSWHEREGSQAGVSSSAHARVEFFLLSIPEQGLLNRSIYEEKQVGLIDNLLTVGDFVKRKGKWVSARDLAVEAMEQAIRDLGL